MPALYFVLFNFPFNFLHYSTIGPNKRPEEQFFCPLMHFPPSLTRVTHEMSFSLPLFVPLVFEKRKSHEWAVGWHYCLFIFGLLPTSSLFLMKQELTSCHNPSLRTRRLIDGRLEPLVEIQFEKINLFDQYQCQHIF